MEKSYLLLLLTILAVNVTAKPRTTDTKASTQDYLLPLNLIPIHYDIQLVPILENLTDETQFELFNFYGDVKITVSVAKQTKMVRMHANKLNIDYIRVEDEMGTPLFLEGDTWELSGDDKQFLTFHLNQTLELGKTYTINIRYIGLLNAELYGFYRSNYLDRNTTGEFEKWMAVTQFESTGARRAFPCWDEPFWKAQFTVAIAHNPIHTVITNMPEKEDANDTLWRDDFLRPNSWESTYFDMSPLMSSYLVAFAVSEFSSKINEESGVSEPIYTDWARPELIAYTDYSNKFAPKAIRHMEAYTGQPYSLDKLDQIAVPDFAAGAMENWGLVTYREPYMLYSEDVSPTSQKMGVASIVSHELAHQWFGDLVSPKWWSHIWLNEGFATFFTYYIMDQVDQAESLGWQRMDAIVSELHYAFQTDGRETTHPMFNPVDSPGSINANFDTIAYSKGASVIRMMQHFLGEDVFQNGIRMYLEDRKYGNADKEDLWRNMEAAIPADEKLNASLASIMDTWVEQSGYPVIKVTRNHQAGTATATQKRFFTLPSSVESPEVWWVPLTMTTETSPLFNDTKVQVWHTGGELSLGSNFEADKWLILNVQEVGYYRVNYDIENWRLLIAGLNAHNADEPIIHAINRAQLLDDAHALARASMLDYPTALDTTFYLSLEREYVPMNAALSASAYIYDRMAYNEDDRYAYEYYMLGRLEPIYSDLGNITSDGNLPVETDMERIFRTLVYSWTCKLNDEQCNTEASNLFNDWVAMNDTQLPSPIHPDLKSVSYCAAIRTGNDSHYVFLEERYSASQYYPGETSLIINSLSCSTNLTKLQFYLDNSILNDSSVRPSDSRSILTAVYNNYLAVDIALNFFLTNYDQCKLKYGQSGAESVFRGIAYKLNTQEHLNQLNEFAAANDETLSASEKSAIDSAVMTLEEILDWHAVHYQAVSSYFQSKLPPPPATPPPSGVAGLLGSPLLAFVTMALAVVLGRP